MATWRSRPPSKHPHPVGDHEGFGLVVRDEEHGGAGLGLDVLEELAHLLAQAGVEAAQGLVQEQDRGLQHERARERHALLLAARDLVHLAPLEPPSRVSATMAAMRRGCSGAGTACMRSPKAMFWPTFMKGKSSGLWKTMTALRFSGRARGPSGRR